MKINVTSPIKDYQNKPIKDGEGVDASDLSFRAVTNLALNNLVRDEQQSPEDKAKVFGISSKLWTADEVDLSVDELAFVKERCAKILPALWYGRVCEIIEGRKKD